ncbi:MAG: efflux RND transporter periplasmic adaptor subunit [Pseudomonadota bacterium]
MGNISENDSTTRPDNMRLDRESNGFEKPAYNKNVPWITHCLVSIGILGIAFLILASLFATKPSANRLGDRPAPKVAVEIGPLIETSFDVWIDSYGTAESRTNTALVAEINGRVQEVSENIRAGGSFKAGDVLVKIDDSNYKTEVDVAASAAADAELAYIQEVAQAEFAAQEWNERPQSEAARKLALREPQVAAAKAALQAAEARLERAKLDLERTQIKAPFDGKVLSQQIDIGQVVSPSQSIAQIYSTDAVEVRLPIKINDLEHLILPDSKQTSRPMVILESELGSRTYQWQAEIVRTEGAFDPATRMLFVVAEVIDPFVNTDKRPAIRVGQFLRAKVRGKTYDNVFVIPRRAVSQDFTVALAQEGILLKRKVEPIWTDTDAIIVSAHSNAGVEENLGQALAKSSLLSSTDSIILTPTANLPNGTRIRPLGMSDQTDQPERPASIAGSENKAPSTGVASGSSASSAK